MKCPRCNAQLADNASFCGICGNALSAPQDSVPQVNPSFSAPENNAATLLAAPWANGPSPRGSQEGSPQTRPTQPPAGWSGGQPGTFQAPQAGSWQQRSPQAGWTPEPQSQFGAAPGSLPQTMDRTGMALPPPSRKRKRAGRIWLRVLLILVLLLAILTGAWFLGVRPYLNNFAQTQLNQALAAPESQMLLAMVALPPGPSPVIHGSESSMNLYLSSHDTDMVQNLHVDITPTDMDLSFTVYGQNNTIAVVPVVSNGEIQVTNVEIQGPLWLIMSNDELTNVLNSNLQSFSAEMTTHKVSQITLLNQEVDIQFD